MQAYWLFKTEPGEYSWDDLLRDGKDVWDGVKAPRALKYLSQIKKGDLIFIYHTGTERAVVGMARAAGAPYPDPKEKDLRRLVIDLIPDKSLPQPVTLQQIKKSGLFPHWELVREPRLSVVRVNLEQWSKILEWGRTRDRSDRLERAAPAPGAHPGPPQAPGKPEKI